MPSCRPRETIVKVPQMADPRLFQVLIPKRFCFVPSQPNEYYGNECGHTLHQLAKQRQPIYKWESHIICCQLNIHHTDAEATRSNQAPPPFLDFYPRLRGVQVLKDMTFPLLQIVPEYVSVERCSGTCHQGNKYHNCIPTQTSVVKKQV